MRAGLLRRLARALGPARPAARAGRRDPLGPAGERCAARFLRRRGYRVLGRNVRVRAGEADLVCLAPDRRTRVIVEVKARRRTAGAPAASNTVAPEASVHEAKRRTLQAVANSLARLNGWRGQPMRIDVVAVEWSDSARKPSIRHFENAVTPR